MKRSAQENFESVIDLPESERQAELDSNGKALELLSVLKDIRTTGATASISGITDQDLVDDLKMLQGKWRHKGWERGKLVEHMVVEINGTQSETRFLDEDGKTIRGRKSRLELSRSGGVKVFKSFQGESPDIGGAFVYEVRQHRLTLVSGLLQNEESLPEIKLRHFFRMKPGETDSGEIEEVPTSLTFDIENSFVTDVYGAGFRHFYGKESIVKHVDWLLSLPTPVTHLKLHSEGLIEANVFQEVSRLDQLQDL